MKARKELAEKKERGKKRKAEEMASDEAGEEGVASEKEN